MEVLIAAGLFLLVGGLATMALSLALGIVVWLVALVFVGVRAAWKALNR